VLFIGLRMIETEGPKEEIKGSVLFQIGNVYKDLFIYNSDLIIQ